jgi:hypothetical protein
VGGTIDKTLFVRVQMMNSIRKGIKNVLEIIASKEEQLTYRENVPTADVPVELLCMWFDDCYHPNSSQHRNAFSIEEQTILSEFNEFYDERVDKLPKNFDELQTNPEWGEIVNEAKKVLDIIKW